MPFRSARLEVLLGHEAAGLSLSDIEKLVGSDVAEGVDLDFKRELYGNSDSDKRALACDVAALANTGGGLILLGVEEDDHARVASVPGVALSDGEQRRITQIIAGNVAPVPRFEVLPLPSDADPAHGVYMLAVERTVAAPHAVVVGDSLRFPRRNGATTRYLTEPEVAEAYRARLSGLAEQQARMATVWEQGMSSLDVDEHVWLGIACVPELAGAATLGKAAYREFENRLRNRTPTIVSLGVDIARTSVLSTGFVADGAREGELSRWVRVEEHSDGSVFFAFSAGWPVERRAYESSDDKAPRLLMIDDECLMVSLLSGLLAGGVHASDRAAASGSISLRAGFRGASANQPTTLGHGRFGGHRDGWSGSHPREQDPTPVDSVASVAALAAAGPALVAVASRLGDGLFRSFGVPECAQASPDGQLRRRYFHGDTRMRLEAWASKHGVELIDDVLPE